jgi:hypothetical protein
VLYSTGHHQNFSAPRRKSGCAISNRARVVASLSSSCRPSSVALDIVCSLLRILYPVDPKDFSARREEKPSPPWSTTSPPMWCRLRASSTSARINSRVRRPDDEKPYVGCAWKPVA